MEMIATFVHDSGTTTLTLAYSAPTVTMAKYVTAWAKYDWHQGYGDHGTEETPIEFDNLTNQDKIDLILERIFNLGKAEAVSQIQVDAIPDQDALDNVAEIEGM